MSFNPVRLDGGGCCNVLLPLPGGLILGGSDTQGYYLSADQARTWTVQNTGIGVQPFWRQSAALLASLTETSPPVVYSLTGEQGHGGGLLAGTYDSTTGNITWQMRSSVPQGAANHCAAPLPTDGWKRSTGRLLLQDSSFLYAGTYNQGLLRSSNTGGGGGGGGTAGRVGSTTTVNIYPNTGTHILAAQAADAIYTRTMAQSCQKLYYTNLPSSFSDGQGTLTPLINGGCAFWLCVAPAKDGSDLGALQTALTWWINNWPLGAADAKNKLKVVLYQECQDHFGNGPVSQQGFPGYLAVCNAYVPMIQQLGLKHVYDAAGHSGATAWTNWYPINPGVTPGSAQDNLCDVVAVDEYGATWVQQGGSATSNPLQHMSDLADAHGKPFCVAEMGSGVATSPVTITQANFILYITAIKNMMVARMAAGKTNSDCMWYSSDHDAAILNAVGGPNTTIAAGSAGGKISNIKTWSSPAPGLLKVASTTGAGFGTAARAGPLWVQCADGTVARINYNGAIKDSTTFGDDTLNPPVLCTYIDGSPNGTVATGALTAVWQFDNGQTADFRVSPHNYIADFYDAVTVAPAAGANGLPGSDNFPVAFNMNGAAPGTGNWFCRAVAADPNTATTLYAAFYNASGSQGIFKSTNAHASQPNMTPLAGSPGTVEDLFVLGDWLYAACGNGGIQRYGPLSGTPAWQNLNGTQVPNPSGTTTDWWSNVNGYVDGSSNHVIYIGNSNATTSAQCLMKLVIPSNYPTGSITYSNETGTVITATEPPGYTWWEAGGSFHPWLGGGGFFCPFTLIDASNLAAVNLYCSGSSGMYRKLAGAANWQVAQSGCPMFLGHPVAANPVHAGHIVFGSSDWCFFDDQAAGTEDASTLGNDPPVAGTQGFAAAMSADGGTVYGSQGTKYSNNGGDVWSRPWNQPNNWTSMGLGAAALAGGKVAIGLAAFNDNSSPPKQIVLAAVRASGMWRWNGSAWTNRSASILAADNSGLLMQVAYYGNGLCFAFDRGSGIWRSSDYGVSWGSAPIWAKTSNDVDSGTLAYDVTRPGRLWVSAAGNLYQVGNALTGSGSSLTGTGSPVSCPGSGTAGPLGTDGAGNIYLCSQDEGNGSGIWGSGDDGNTWTDITGGDGSFARCNANPEQMAVGPFEAAAGAPRVYVSGSNVVAFGYPAGSPPPPVSAPFTEVQSNQNLLGVGGVLPMWFGPGGMGSTRGNLLIARVELSDGTATVTPSDPGWQLAVDVPAASGTSTARVQIWWYPDNPGGIGGQGYAPLLSRPGHRVTPAPARAPVLAGAKVLRGAAAAPGPFLAQAPAVIAGTVVPADTATFTCSNTSATIKGKLQEYSSGAGTIQYLDQTGTASATSSATSLPVTATAANTYTGGLGIAFFGATLTGGTTGQSWSVPSGWVSPADGVANNLALVFSMYYQTGLTAGPTSATGSITLGTWTMTAWAGAVATFYALAATPVTISTTSLPDGTVGTAYGPGGAGVALAVSGGTGPGTYSFAITNGGLPDGLLLDPAAGVISGIPQTAINYGFTVTATDQASQTASVPLTININSGVTITPSSFPGGTAGQPYSAEADASGGSAPFTWTVVAGSLPPGLALQVPGSIPGASVLVTGTPILAGTYTFTLQAQDTLGAIGTQPLSVTIAPSGALVITTTGLPAGTLGQSYHAQFEATGGNRPYHWALASGSLPPTLTLGDDGSVTGTLTKTGDYPFTVTVTDT